MKKTLLILVYFISVSISNGQYSAFLADNSYKYVATPGFVNVTELNGAYGLVNHGEEGAPHEPGSVYSAYYYGVTNIFGYQIDRNFFGGVGVGYLHYEGGGLFPVYLEYKYNMYLRRFSPYFYADGGGMVHLSEFYDESKIFVNPGIGLSRTISPKLEVNLSVGYMIQARTTLSRVTFLNFKAGIILRKNGFRMFRSDKPEISNRYFYNTLH
ncbi:MAG TPA: hypothetical protein DDW27_15255 [Bacteroidales bacterium]|nr:hypothetical protein [Bacteroidales bacterium]